MHTLGGHPQKLDVASWGRHSVPLRDSHRYLSTAQEGMSLRTLRPHQTTAVDAVLREFTAAAGRTTVVMPCASGKTGVGAGVASALASRDGTSRCVIVAPYIELLSQILGEWRLTRGAAALGQVVAVCSDEGLLREYEQDLREQRAYVTCAAEELAALTARPGPVTVATTYASLRVIAEAHHAHAMAPFDLLVSDEAHRSAGHRTKAWADVHRTSRVRASYRLYMTATPKVLLSTEADADEADDVVSMDNTDVYGEVCHRLTHAEARGLGLLAECRLRVPVVTDEQLHAAVQNGGPQMQSGRSAVSPRMLAAQIAVLKAAHQYDLTRIITFHNTVADARWFAQTLPAAAELLPAQERPASLWAGHVHGRHSRGDRAAARKRLGSQDNGLTVVANCRVFGEGLDVPAVSAVGFIGVRNSSTEIIQAIGRALRTGGQVGKIASVIVPVFLGTGESPEAALNSSPFEPVWRVAQALAAHDEEFAAELIAQRRSMGNGRTERAPAEVPSWLSISGIPVPPGFAAALTLKSVRVTTSSWHEYYGAAQAYREREGNLQVRRDHRTSSGLNLGRWIADLRRRRQCGELTDEQITAMNVLGMDWDGRERERRLLRELNVYKEAFGDLMVPVDYATGGDDPFPLGPVTSYTRKRLKEGRLDPGFVAELESLGFVPDVLEKARKVLLSDLDTYKKQYGDLLVPQTYSVPGTGRRLGAQVHELRKKRKTQSVPPSLVEELEMRGFVWDPAALRFTQILKDLDTYQEQYGDLLVPKHYVAPGSGRPLGKQVNELRIHRRRGSLPESDFQQLAARGFVWDVSAYVFARTLKDLTAYRKQHGGLLVPADYVTPGTNRKLGIHVSSLRRSKKARTLPRNQFKALAARGFVWDVPAYVFARTLKDLTAYRKQHGDLLVPADYVTPGTNRKLGEQVNNLRKAKKKGTLPDAHAEALVARGFVWDVSAYVFARTLKDLTAYRKQHGDLLVPGDFVTPGTNRKLGKQVAYLRSRRSRLSAAETAALDALGFVWDVLADEFAGRLRQFTAYTEQHGLTNLTRYSARSPEARALARWWNAQLAQYRAGTLSAARIQAITAAGLSLPQPHAASGLSVNDEQIRLLAHPPADPTALPGPTQ
ncbi:Helicase associated domain protein [Streptomyces sp. NBC_00838]|uniref:DEAD/DEAH box helicase n=1 Tax=Streptomyces sp. NBC_00838 TaxID=2903680 RepID=UPI003868258B|nr:Helicase associated domain protein [Streptomyces sp. NBC_00838]